MRTSTLAPPMRKAQPRSHTTQTLPAPIGGLDSISPLALMPPNNAVEVDNFIATDAGLSVREGWYEYAYGIDSGSAIRTVMSHDRAPQNGTANPLAASELFACTDSGIFLIEGRGGFTGVAPNIALSGALDAGRFSSVQFSTAGNSYLVACSEIDGPFSTMARPGKRYAASDIAGPGQINDIDPSKFVQVISWKKRLIFVESRHLEGLGSRRESIGGTAVLFDFGRCCRTVVTSSRSSAGRWTQARASMIGSWCWAVRATCSYTRAPTQPARQRSDLWLAVFGQVPYLSTHLHQLRRQCVCPLQVLPHACLADRRRGPGQCPDQ